MDEWKDDNKKGAKSLGNDLNESEGAWDDWSNHGGYQSTPSAAEATVPSAKNGEASRSAEKSKKMNSRRS